MGLLLCYVWVTFICAVYYCLVLTCFVCDFAICGVFWLFDLWGYLVRLFNVWLLVRLCLILIGGVLCDVVELLFIMLV